MKPDEALVRRAFETIVELDSTLEIARLSLLRLALDVATIGEQVAAVEDRLAGRRPRRGTKWRIRALATQRLLAAGEMDLGDDGNRTAELFDQAMHTRRQRPNRKGAQA